MVIDTVSLQYALSDLLRNLSLSRGNYYLCRAIRRRKDKYREVKDRTREIFDESRETYGYRQAKIEMEKNVVCISEKIIRRLMREMGLVVKQQPNHAKLFFISRGDYACNKQSAQSKLPCRQTKREVADGHH